MNNVLLVGAHPDDIEIGCTGTILKLKKNGKKVYCVVMTNGGNWEKKTYEDRLDEQKNSFNHLSIDKVIYGPCQDGNIKHIPNLIDFISEIIRKYQIDTIITHYKNDTHQDHKATSLISKSASINCKNLLYFESLTSIDFKPNFFVEINTYEKEKQKVLSYFTSQNDKYNSRNQSLIDFVNAKDRLNGIKIREKYAEGLIVDKLLDNDVI